MSGRPALLPGQRGDVSVKPQRQDDEGKWKTAATPQAAQRWRARCQYRGHDGVADELNAVGKRRRDAEAALNAKWERIHRGVLDGYMTESTTLADAGRQYLAVIARPESGLAPRTVDDYTRTFARYIDNPKVGAASLRALTLAQANNPQRVRLFLDYIAEHHGPSAAKQARTVLMNVLSLAVDYNVLTINAVRHVRPPRGVVVRHTVRKVGVPRDTRRALTEEERSTLVAMADALAGDPEGAPQTRRKRQVTADLLAFMAGTGVRVSEARGLRWDDVDLAGVRSKGEPTVHIRGTKSKSADRLLDVPTDLVARLERRAADSGRSGYVFASPHLTGESKARVREEGLGREVGDALVAEPAERPWDQSNCASALAGVFAAAGLPWATPHTLRRTVASVLHTKGVPLVVISDVLGHSDPAMTSSVYLGRNPHANRPDVRQYLKVGN